MDAPNMIIPTGATVRIYQSNADRAEKKLAFFDLPGQTNDAMEETSGEFGGKLQTYGDDPGNYYTELDYQSRL